MRLSALTCLAAALLLTLSACDGGGGDPPNESPSVDFTFSPSNPRAGVTSVGFSANASDADGRVVSYSWDFDGDGTQDASGSTASHVFATHGSLSVQLTVEDDEGGSNTTTKTVEVQQQYTQVAVNAVTVEAMPFTTTEGEGWDLSSGPDLYFRALDADEQQLAQSGRVDDVGPEDLPVMLEDGSFTIEDLAAEHTVYLLDYDATGDDGIGGITFTLEGLVGGYPETTTLELDDFTFELALEWKE